MNNDTASTASLLDDTYMVPILKKNPSGANLLKVTKKRWLGTFSGWSYDLRKQGVNSIVQKDLGQILGQVFGPKLGEVLTVSISLPRPAFRPIFNLTSRANFRAKTGAKIYLC